MSKNGKKVWKENMRSLKKNKQPFHYATYSEEIKVYQRDENGNIVYVEVDGEQIPIELGTMAGYNEPVIFNANISAGKGSAQEEVFGTGIDFTRTISTADLSCPIDELSLLWIDIPPAYLADGTVDPDSADYKVAAKPAKGLNSIMIAIKALPVKGK